jgi:hypothetical protein
MWYRTSYRRNLIDMHIPDGDEGFLSKFDPQHYVEMLSLAQVDTAYVYATSCLGLCYWPTKIGRMHAGLKGRDIFGEILALCKRRGINGVAYYNHWSLWAYDKYPEWRLTSIDGRGTADYLWTPGSYGVCCPNSPYRDFVVEQIKDLCSRYEFCGMWFDMGHWAYTVCYCPHCRGRYRAETGRDIPTVVDWTDSAWRQFIDARNRWLTEYTALITQTAKSGRPGISVGHQSAGWQAGWRSGACQGFYAQSDYLGGDFYGSFSDQSMCCKFLGNLTRDKPFEFMTSRCPDLSEHTTAKPIEQLRIEIFLTLAHNGAFFFVDAIDPAGTLDSRAYEMMGTLYAEAERYEPFLDYTNVLREDVGIYFNFESLADLSKNGVKVTENGKGIPAVGDMVHLSQTLIQAHIPFGWISDRNLNDLARRRAVLIPDFVRLSPREAEAIADFVKEGGKVLVLRGRYLLGPAGDPAVAEIFSRMLGLRYEGGTPDTATYIAPTNNGKHFFPDHTAEYPLAAGGSHSKVRVTGDGETLATITLPYSDGSDPKRFSSAISNPPWQSTDLPAIVLNRFGQGSAMFVSGALERGRHGAQKEVLGRLVKYLGGPLTFETDAPKCVEVTALYNRERNRYTVNFVNCQEVIPNVPVPPMTVRLRVGNAERVKVVRLPDLTVVPHHLEGGRVAFKTDVLETFLMYYVELP